MGRLATGGSGCGTCRQSFTGRLLLVIVGRLIISRCQGECLLPNLLGKFYDQQQHCDVVFQLQDGSTVQVTGLTW